MTYFKMVILSAILLRKYIYTHRPHQNFNGNILFEYNNLQYLFILFIHLFKTIYYALFILKYASGIGYHITNSFYSNSRLKT